MTGISSYNVFTICFNSLLFTPLVRKGFGSRGSPKKQRSTLDRWDQQFISYIYHSPGKENTTCHSSHGEVALRREQSGALGGRFCSIKKVRYLLVPVGICDCLAWVIPWLVGNWNLPLRDQQELHLVHLIRRVISPRDLICMSRVGRGTCVWAIWGLPDFIRYLGST